MVKVAFEGKTYNVALDLADPEYDLDLFKAQISSLTNCFEELNLMIFPGGKMISRGGSLNQQRALMASWPPNQVIVATRATTATPPPYASPQATERPPQPPHISAMGPQVPPQMTPDGKQRRPLNSLPLQVQLPVLTQAVQQLRARAQMASTPQIMTQLTAMERELARVTNEITAQGGNVDAIIAAFQQQQQRRVQQGGGQMRNPAMRGMPQVPMMTQEQKTRAKEHSFRQHLERKLTSMARYELDNWQAEARKKIPIAELEQKARVLHQAYMQKRQDTKSQVPDDNEMSECPSTADHRHVMELGVCTKCNQARPVRVDSGSGGMPSTVEGQLLQYKDFLLSALMTWFKSDFFKWVDKPACSTCGSITTNRGMAPPTAEDKKWGAGRVERYICPSGHFTLFPRYNNATKLLQTRKGRCGEWTQAFVLCVRALGFEVRMTFDWSDHVWAEVYSDSLERWIHCDPCENRADRPLMYEVGWKKKQNYVISFERDQIVDVTRRYTRVWEETKARRTLVTDEFLFGLITTLNTKAQANATSTRKEQLITRALREAKELQSYETDLLRPVHAEENAGRISGDTQWKQSRGEGDGSSSSVTETKSPNRQRVEEFMAAAVKKYTSHPEWKDPSKMHTVLFNKSLSKMQMLGKRHPDTKIENGLDRILKLNSARGQDNKKMFNRWHLSIVRVWHSDKFVHGLQQVWTNLDTGRRGEGALNGGCDIGGPDNVQLSEVVLKPNEYIISVCGTHGDIVDSMAFATTHGRTFTFGNPDGGGFFLISLPFPKNLKLAALNADSKVHDYYLGYAVVAFDVGAGGHLHSIGISVRAIVDPSFAHYDKALSEPDAYTLEQLKFDLAASQQSENKESTAKEDARKLFKILLAQVKEGCGAENCKNENCASNPLVEALPNQKGIMKAAKLLKLYSKGDQSVLCGNLMKK